MNKVGARRLLKLSKFLKDNKRKINVNMSYWALSEHNGMPECGSSACALGWATTIPSFRKAGLRLYYKSANARCYVQYNKERHPVSAASKFFNISEDDAQHIFTDWAHVYGAKAINEVCRKIEKLVKEYHP